MACLGNSMFTDLIPWALIHALSKKPCSDYYTFPIIFPHPYYSVPNQTEYGYTLILAEKWHSLISNL